MEYSVSIDLKAAWGSKSCDHPHFEKVYYNGAFLINYSCTVCGADFTIAQKMEIDQNRKKMKKAALSESAGA